MKLLLVFVAGSIFFFPGLQAFRFNGNPKLGNLVQEMMGERQSSYQVSDTPHASLQDEDPECMKWKVNAAEKIVQVLTQKNEVAQKAQTQCEVPCLLQCAAECNDITSGECQRCQSECCSNAQKRRVAKKSFITTQDFSDRCLRCVRACYRLYKTCTAREGASISGCINNYNICRGYCGCGVKQKYVAVDSMYSSVAKAQDDLDAAIAELKYIVERAPQNCYF